MFAFGMYDSTKRVLLMARDRVGEKPLFYSHTAGKLTLVSELKALMADPIFPRQLDPEALDHYLAYGYVPGEMCILKGVRKLPPAHAASYDIEKDHLEIWPYWQLPEPASDRQSRSDEFVDELECLLQDAVKKQLVADVPVGILLSGGIDSSLVTAMAARTSTRPVKTFTISFRGYGAYDEAPYARKVADHFRTEHTELVAEPSTVDLLPELARQYDEPMADSSMLPTFLVSRLVRQHAAVALTGDGGDELFGGYLYYTRFLHQERVHRWMPKGVSRLARFALGHVLPVGFPGRGNLLQLASAGRDRIAYAYMFDARYRQRLFPRPTPPTWTDSDSMVEAYKRGLCDQSYSLLQQATRVDFSTYLPDDLMVKVDRASMLNSLETRAPRLDYRIVELAFGRVPDRFKLAGKERKILPRRLSQRVLPHSLNLERKRGFSIPLSNWIKGGWKKIFESVLSDCGIFDQRTVARLLANQRRGYSNADRLFLLVMFELWRREYRVTM